MTIQEFYQRVDGDYEAVLENMLSDDNILQFMEMFLHDPNYGRLTEALEQGENQQAFKAAHTLKGVSANLSYGRLYEAAAALTEDLRDGKTPDGVKEHFPRLQQEYEQVITAIHELLEMK
jgi:HPt (histidine-containing phosphotransfer) domain-containing protein